MKTILVYDKVTDEIMGVFSESSGDILYHFDEIPSFAGKSYIEISQDHPVVTDTAAWHVDKGELQHHGIIPFHYWDKSIRAFAFQKEKWLEYEIRSIRNKLLGDSDYTMLYDNVSKMSEEEITEWKIYRQLLRDFPATLTEYIPTNELTLPGKPNKKKTEQADI